jgi:hypothetical protein
MSILRISIIAMSISVLLALDTSAQAIRTGRSVALAGSNALGMYGAEAVGWNPANLGLSANPRFSITALSFSTSIGNNAFTPNYSSKTFVKDKFLGPAEKNDIISKLSSDRLNVYGNIGLPLLGFSGGNYAFNIDTHFLVNTSIPKDIFKLMLNGPVQDKIYTLGNVEGEGLGYWTAALSLAKPLENVTYMKEFAVGASFKYIGGIAYGELDHKEGTIQITDQVIHANGYFRNLSASKGDGVALDLAAAGVLQPVDLYVGMTLGNLVGSIYWSKVTAHEVHFSKNEGVSLDSVSNNNYWRNFFTQSDKDYSANPVRTSLPTYLMFSADRPYLEGKGDLFCTYYQGLNNVPGQSTTPRLSIGSEFRYIPALPLRAGIAVGGSEGSEFSAGFGFKFLYYQLNFGASWQRGVFAGAKGFSFALTNYFGPKFEREDDRL